MFKINFKMNYQLNFQKTFNFSSMFSCMFWINFQLNFRARLLTKHNLFNQQSVKPSPVISCMFKMSLGRLQMTKTVTMSIRMIDMWSFFRLRLLILRLKQELFKLLVNVMYLSKPDSYIDLGVEEGYGTEGENSKHAKPRPIDIPGDGVDSDDHVGHGGDDNLVAVW